MSLSRWTTEPVRTTSDACTVAEVIEKGNKDIQLKLSLDHQGVRTVAGLYNHTYDLTNLESLSILLQYTDALGLEENLNRNELQIRSDVISRAQDALPMYDGGCLLDYNGTTRSPDGFLQSDLTMPLHRCEPTLSDADGVHSTVWNMTFFNNQGEAVYSIDLQCRGTFFPADWSFGDAFNSGQCTDPECTAFPSKMRLMSVFGHIFEITPCSTKMDNSTKVRILSLAMIHNAWG